MTTVSEVLLKFEWKVYSSFHLAPALWIAVSCSFYIGLWSVKGGWGLQTVSAFGRRVRLILANDSQWLRIMHFFPDLSLGELSRFKSRPCVKSMEEGGTITPRKWAVWVPSYIEFSSVLGVYSGWGFNGSLLNLNVHVVISAHFRLILSVVLCSVARQTPVGDLWALPLNCRFTLGERGWG